MEHCGQLVNEGEIKGLVASVLGEMEHSTLWLDAGLYLVRPWPVLV